MKPPVLIRPGKDILEDARDLAELLEAGRVEWRGIEYIWDAESRVWFNALDDEWQAHLSELRYRAWLRAWCSRIALVTACTGEWESTVLALRLHPGPAQTAASSPADVQEQPVAELLPTGAVELLYAVRELQEGVRALAGRWLDGQYEAWGTRGPVEKAAYAWAEAVQELAEGWRDHLRYLEQSSGIGSGRTDAEETCSGLPIRGPYTDCHEGRWTYFRCKNPTCQKIHAKWVGCKRLDCRNCAEVNTLQRAGRIYDDAGDLADAWGVVVLTTPPKLRQHVMVDARARLRRAAAETVHGWLKWRGHKGDVGTVVFFHPVGSLYLCPRHVDANAAAEPLDDEDPCRIVRYKVKSEMDRHKRCPHCASKLVATDDDVFNPHWNVLFPLVEVLDDGKSTYAKRIESWATEDELDELRARWARRLARELTCARLDVINVHYEYRRKVEKIRHAFRYFGRAFPGWKRWVTTAGGNKYGGLANRSVGAFRAAIKASLGLVRRQKRVWKCECGGEVEFLRLGSPATWRVVPGGVIPPDKPRWMTELRKD